MNIYFLGNYTQELIAKEFEVISKKEIPEINVFVSGYNQYRQEIINKESLLYSIKPEIIILSLDLFTLLDDLIYTESKMDSRIDQITERIEENIKLFSILSDNLSGSQIFIDNFFFFRPATMATLEYNSSYSYLEAEEISNLKLTELVRKLHNVKIIDTKSLIKQLGINNLFDERMHYIAKSHWSLNGIKQLTKLYLRYIKAYQGKRKKCLVLDLDDTLWGGIIGEDGIENIQLSNDGIGKAFYDFQREIYKLYKRGILLALNSKNSKDIALNAIDNHPYMILRSKHFICLKINWNNKAQNLEEIAKEINIGSDSFVFLDDSPFERELISTRFPEVYVPELPEDPSEYPNFIRKLEVFDFLNITNDDLHRNEMYITNKKREYLKTSIDNIEDFYYSLKMIATVGRVTDFDIPRIAQMTQKTNQFNLTTKRYSIADIKNFQIAENYDVYFLNIADKFGDNGIVGTAIIKKETKQTFIDSFLLSCRVIGRTAETALLNYIIREAIKSGQRKIIGEFIPTKKNSPCNNFYESHNFKQVRKNYWEANLETYKIKDIPWIKINGTD